ncbi:hypothetical protein P879_03489 [Paragonimus westermani]|uniref:Uncharacterized protein n=1 Tax=Paragonimus westermani TaxID=34504 RepID=A0A8T0DVE8_9TREM|nr:hypothetical protein P879_03489 [Paragonimus westermani]
MIKRKISKRSSAQYYISAEDHVENEVKHERLLAETSRLSSSWASLSVSGNEKTESECSSASVSANSSPNHRPNSFSGPLLISVTCSGSACTGANNCCPTQLSSNRGTPTSPTPYFLSSGHASPVASPVSSRVQCYSPSLVSSTSSPTARRPNPGSASPLLISTALCRKRGYLSSGLTAFGSNDDAGREESPDLFMPIRGTKSMRQSDGRNASYSDTSQFRWPPGPPLISNPPSPSCNLFATATGNCTAPSSPSTSSLSSPRLSLTSTVNAFVSSPASSVVSTQSAPAVESRSVVETSGVNEKSVPGVDGENGAFYSPEMLSIPNANCEVVAGQDP